MENSFRSSFPPSLWLFIMLCACYEKPRHGVGSNLTFFGYQFIGSYLSAGYVQTETDGTMKAIFISVLDAHLLAVGVENKAKNITMQALFQTYKNKRPALNEVTLPPTLLALC